MHNTEIFFFRVNLEWQSICLAHEKLTTYETFINSDFDKRTFSC